MNGDPPAPTARPSCGRSRRSGAPRSVFAPALAVAVALLLAAGCAAAPSTAGDRGPTTPATATSPTPPGTARGSVPPSPPGSTTGSTKPGPGGTATGVRDPRDDFHPAAPDWLPCKPTGYQCATVTVPLDYADPTGTQIDLKVSRKPATDKSQKIGSVFFNPGGPGASGVEELPMTVKELSPDVLDRFDIVSWDPRGVGGSVPISCDDGAYTFYAQDLTVDDVAPAADDAAKAWGEECQRKAGELLPFVGTADVARDLDVLREAVGDDKLNYLGVSYGTLIGLIYADLFPTRIRSMILDGVVDPTTEGDQSNLDQSKAVDDALATFAQQCAADPTCPIRDDPNGAIDQIQVLARQGKLHAKVNGVRQTISPTLAALGIIVATYDEESWPALATAIAQAIKGDDSTFAMFVEAYLSIGSFGANAAINCLDASRPTAQELDDLADQAAAVAPRAGRFNANAGRICEFWPVDPKPLPSELTTDGAPPIMVWGTTGDNATPYKNAVHVAQILPGARLVTLDGNRHAAIGANECVRRAQSAYLIDLELPPVDHRC